MCSNDTNKSIQGKVKAMKVRGKFEQHVHIIAILLQFKLGFWVKT
jgi:hypothetical protein